MYNFFKKYVDKDVGKQLRISGFKHKALFQYKNGYSIPKPDSLYKICFVISAVLDLELKAILIEALEDIEKNS